MSEIVQQQDSRRIFVETLNELAEHDPNIIVIICDVGFNYLDDPNNKFKVINFGVTEMSSMIVASVLAREGFSVWFYSMIPFTLFRPYEAVRNAVVKHSSPLKLIGVKGSTSYKFLGFSHNLSHEREDINVCENIGLKSFVPQNLEEVRDVILKSYQDNSACYIRL